MTSTRRARPHGTGGGEPLGEVGLTYGRPIARRGGRARWGWAAGGCALLASLLLGACDSRVDARGGPGVSGDAGPIGGDCDPLAGDCTPGSGCYPAGFGGAFECEPLETAELDGGSGEALAGAGEPCMVLTDCAPGHECLGLLFSDECATAAGCCAPYCDLGQGDPCVAWGLVCRPYFDSEPPPGYETLGLCMP